MNLISAQEKDEDDNNTGVTIDTNRFKETTKEQTTIKNQGKVFNKQLDQFIEREQSLREHKQTTIGSGLFEKDIEPNQNKQEVLFDDLKDVKTVELRLESNNSSVVIYGFAAILVATVLGLFVSVLSRGEENE